MSYGYRWRVTFEGFEGNLALLKPDGAMFTGDDPRIAVNEVVPGFNDLTVALLLLKCKISLLQIFPTWREL